jgi:hypothetical protein
MKTYVHFLYLPEFLIEWEMFPTEVVERIKTRILYIIIFFPRKSCRLWDNVERYSRARQATDDNTISRMRCASCVTQKKLTRNNNTGGFSTATMVSRMCINDTFIRTLPVLFKSQTCMPSQLVISDTYCTLTGTCFAHALWYCWSTTNFNWAIW